jgi:hypothetical protein
MIKSMLLSAEAGGRRGVGPPVSGGLYWLEIARSQRMSAYERFKTRGSAAKSHHDAAINIALEEYRQLWTWYKNNVEHRKYLFDWYFKAVELPAIVVVAASKLPGSEKVFISPPVAAALLWAIFAIGLVAFSTYALESSNASKYNNGLKDIRRWFVTVHGDLEHCLTIDRHRTRPRGSVDPIKYSRGSIIAVANSAVFVAAMALSFEELDWIMWLGLGLVALVAHLLIYQKLFDWYSRSVPADAAT